MTLLPEWAPQQAVLMTWPHAGMDFAASLPEAQLCALRIASTLSRHVDLLLVVPDADSASMLPSQIARAGGDASRLHCHPLPSNDVWTRDYGPLAVSGEQGLSLLDFRFDAWGGKYAANHDDAIAAALDAAGAFNRAHWQREDFILEGGSIDSDGAGSLLTTRQCLLAGRDGGSRSQAGVEARLGPLLGIDRWLWLDVAPLSGDDTDAHIDTLARFASADTIVWQGCQHPADPQQANLRALGEQLAALRQRDNQPYRLVELPSPAPLHDADGQRLPAGYANFLITNGAVLVPAYADPADEIARARIAACFPGRDTRSLDCRALVHQYGSLHCATMQIPA